MQMLCKVSTPFSDVNCPVCGQGFLVYWTRKRAGEREQQQLSLQHALRQQHGALETADVHPPAFQLPEQPVAAAQNHTRPAAAVTPAIPVYN